MIDFARLFTGAADPGLPPSLLRPNSGPLPGAAPPPGFLPNLPGPLSEAEARENVNAAPWSKRFACNFIEPGLVLYRGGAGAADEMVLVEADALDRMAPTLIGKPVIDWDHADVWPEILGDGQADGVVYDVWKGADGWWHAGFVVWTKSAVEHAESGDWSVSCAYSSTEEDGTPGRYHNINYTQRVLDGVYTHLALVKNPRYEKARIRANSTENGGYKMGWKLFEKAKKPDEKVLRLNAAEGAEAMLEVDGAPVKMNELIATHNAACAPSNIMTASDEDEVEHEGKRYKVGELRQAHRNAMARKNAEDEKKEKDEKEKKERENAARRRANDVQLGGAGKEKEGKLAGAGADKSDGVGDNPDMALEAGKELAALKERLNSVSAELAELKKAPSRELRAAAHLRVNPLGGEPEDQGFATVEDRIRRGNADFALSASGAGE